MGEKTKLSKAVDEFAVEMEARLHQMANQGYRGWAGEYPEKNLRLEILDDALGMRHTQTHGNVVDIANRCMMLWIRDNHESGM